MYLIISVPKWWYIFTDQRSKFFYFFFSFFFADQPGKFYCQGHRDWGHLGETKILRGHPLDVPNEPNSKQLVTTADSSKASEQELCPRHKSTTPSGWTPVVIKLFKSTTSTKQLHTRKQTRSPSRGRCVLWTHWWKMSSSISIAAYSELPDEKWAPISIAHRGTAKIWRANVVTTSTDIAGPTRVAIQAIHAQ